MDRHWLVTTGFGFGLCFVFGYHDNNLFSATNEFINQSKRDEKRRP